MRVKGGLRLAYLPELCIRGSINDDFGFGVLANVTLIDRSEILRSGSVQSTKSPRAVLLSRRTPLYRREARSERHNSSRIISAGGSAQR